MTKKRKADKPERRKATEEGQKLTDCAVDTEARELPGTWKWKYEELVDSIRRMRQDAELLRDDMEKNGLCVGTIEAEGFLRCIITVCNIMDFVEENSTLE